jgi:hypothetical protein
MQPQPLLGNDSNLIIDDYIKTRIEDMIIDLRALRLQLNLIQQISETNLNLILRMISQLEDM